MNLRGAERAKTLWAIFFSLCASWSFGQAPTTRDQVVAPPPPYQFAPWKEASQPQAGTEYLETFDSPVTTGYKANDTAYLRVFVPDTGTGPFRVVLIAHYWGASDLKGERSLATDLNRRGLAAAILTLPYHMERTPPGYHSGQLAIQPHPEKLESMMLQSEQDERRSMDFLDSRPEFVHGEYGLAGISLGALVAGLTYAVDDRVKFATFALGGADLSHIIWVSSKVVAQREALRRQGWTEAKLREALAPIEPLNYLPRKKPGSTFVIEGKYDTVVPPQSTEELIANLDHPQVLQLDTGHYGGIFVERKVLKTVADYFATTMGGKPYRAPNSLAAPTIRIGGLLAYPQGVDLGVGVDIFHIDRRGTEFGTIFATPRGLRFYLGQNLTEGFSLGLVGSGKGVGAGLMWSIVL